VIPELTRFYGGSANEWFMSTPIAIVRAYAAKLRNIEAKESLLERERIAAGTGSLKKTDAKLVLSRWNKLAKGTRASVPVRPDQLRSVGIGYRKAKRGDRTP